MEHPAKHEEYEPPALTLLGSVHQLTQKHVKWHGQADGHSFVLPITNHSP